MQEFAELFAIVIFIVIWWLARRDLVRLAEGARTPQTAEWERLRAAVEALTADLERRAAAAEQRITEAEERLLLSEGRFLPNAPAPEYQAADLLTDAFPDSEALATSAYDPYAGIHALIAEGNVDAGEISRSTGVPQGEVELILGLRARQARL